MSAATEEVIELIFEKGFSQRAEKSTAHGLGLWLCRQVLLKYFNATITAKNAENKSGAVFTIKIPVKNENGILVKREPLAADYLIGQGKGVSNYEFREDSCLPETAI